MNNIHILYNLFGEGTAPTAVVGKYYISAYQIEHKSTVLKLLNDLEVDRCNQQVVMDLLEDYNPNEKFDLNTLNFLYDYCVKINALSLYESVIKTLIVKYYSTELRDYLFSHKNENVTMLGIDKFSTEQIDQLVLSEHVSTRKTIAQFCESRYLDILVNDIDEDVRMEVAKRGLEKIPLEITGVKLVHSVAHISDFKKYLDILVYDPSEWVRSVVARHGYKKYLDILVYDPSEWVRRAVATQGFKEHLDILVHDKEYYVRVKVAEFGFKEHLDILVNDEDAVVRLAVTLSKIRNEKHQNILSNDTNMLVRMSSQC